MVNENADKPIGRPKNHIRLATEKILAKYPHISPKQLQQILQHQLKQKIQLNYIYQLKHRTNKNSTKPTIIVNIANFTNLPIHDVLTHFILRKEAQIRLNSNLHSNASESPYTITRYQSNPTLFTTDSNGKTRRCIQRLLDKETFITSPHIHACMHALLDLLAASLVQSLECWVP